MPKLAEELFSLDNQWVPFSWSRECWLNLNHDYHLVLILEDKEISDSPCGFVLFHWVEGNDFCQLLKICVTSEIRGTGAAATLLGDSLLIFERKGVQKVFLEVQEANKQALKFYEKNGFSTVRLKPKYYSCGESALEMLKAI